MSFQPADGEAGRQIACALCGAEDYQLLYRPPYSPGPIARCPRCGLVYVSPRLKRTALIFDGPVLGDLPARLLTSRNLADVEGTWEMPLLRSKEAEYPALRLNGEAALDRLCRFVDNPGRLLDFGCGGGFFLGTAKERGWEVYGLEPLPGHAVYARARFDAQVVTDTLRKHAFPPAFFDAITAFQVFEHLPDPVGDLQALAQCLSPRGAILIEVPNIETWSVNWLGARHRHFVQDHLYFFSAKTLTQMMARCGLEVVETYYPSRRITVRHLVTDWGSRLLPSPLARLGVAAARRAGALDMIISLNIGDVVAAIGKKKAKTDAG